MKIQEEYVGYDTAIMLKKLGFNELCGAYYSEFVDDWKTLLFWKCGKPKTYDEVRNSGYLLVPTQSIVMRWFREEYDLEIRATYDYDKSTWWGETVPMYDEDDENSDLFQKLLRFDYKGKTYEEAIEKGIQYAIEKLYDYGYTRKEDNGDNC